MKWLLIPVLVWLGFFYFIPTDKVGFAEIEKGFVKPPDSIQTSVYWYWISDNLSKEGVVKDLQAMKAVGINRAFIGFIGLENPAHYGKVKMFSEEWWTVVHTALKTATDLGIEIGIFNSPGWSQSGGPWVKPEQAMRYLSSSETYLNKPGKVSVKLPKPAGNFQDVKVLAFRVPKDYQCSYADLKPTITAVPYLTGIANIMDKNEQTEVELEAGKTAVITMTSAGEFSARSLTIYPSKRNLSLDVKLEALEKGSYKEIKQFKVDRSNNKLHVGFQPFAPVVVSFDAVNSSSFRLTFSNPSAKAGIAEIRLSPVPKVERFVEKTLAKMHPTPLPYWHEYQWAIQPAVKETELLIDKTSVIDISKNMSADGTLNWTVPNGEWIVLRTGMLPTGVENGPASPEATGLEVDKMNHEHVAKHFEAFMGEIQRRIPAQDRKSWKVAVQDSYEMGGQNWTDDFITKFRKRHGYDPIPFIPAMYGHVIGSQDQSDRFLWDLRRFVADNIAYEYVGGLRDVSHKNGLTIWLENYGHWGFPGEFLQYGGQSDEIGGEFWSEGELGDIENRAASSAAHIYGKTKVSAESFTAGGNTFGRYPSMMKQRGDRFFTEGINNTLLHVYIHQPYEGRKPGVNAWFGNEFNRFNTWFYDMDMFIQYLKRCNFMLQQGKYVADVAYFIGEDAPKMTGIQDPKLPPGYSFDYINAEVILNRLTITDGRFMLPDGLSYKILVLPALETIRPDLLAKIESLVKAGGVILGPIPKRSPSLVDYPNADTKVKKMATQLWGNIDGQKTKTHPYGKGMVMSGFNLQQAMNWLGMVPDFNIAPNDPALFIHRRTAEGEIYFVSNQSDKKININPAFRVSDKTPELWNAITGKMRDLPQYTSSGKTTSVPLQLEAYESAFVVFRKPFATATKNIKLNFPEPSQSLSLKGDWTVRFDKESRGPEEPVVFKSLTDWSKNTDERIKYYAGSAVYTKSFKLKKPMNGQRIYVELGAVTALAKVKVNGKETGGVWTAPYKVDITEAVQEGDNKLEVKVVNNWVNRMIGDLNLPEAQRKTWSLVNPYKADSPLHPAGLLGPVVLKTFSY
ncbi:glycosyl hydrolase [Pedobacter heparinus]|uniref:glycosyl hydrolase n=1 Tax=Pedobacter heparinus TaxID=984 RepID=UPI00292D9864|nr:glycosyl hydrolase [Pedobacter heparinus]